MKSVEQKLYEAYRSEKGVTLSAEDVLSLVEDEAIGTRISNTAAYELGIDQPGASCIPQRPKLSWIRFGKSLEASDK